MIKSININNYSVLDHEPIVNAIKKINEKKNNLQFLIIINSENKLMGTLTDGDIRRLILKESNHGFKLSKKC